MHQKQRTLRESATVYLWDDVLSIMKSENHKNFIVTAEGGNFVPVKSPIG